MSLPLELVNDIIMMQRPKYSYLNDLMMYHYGTCKIMKEFFKYVEQHEYVMIHQYVRSAPSFFLFLFLLHECHEG